MVEGSLDLLDVESVFVIGREHANAIRVLESSGNGDSWLQDAVSDCMDLLDVSSDELSWSAYASQNPNDHSRSLFLFPFLFRSSSVMKSSLSAAMGKKQRKLIVMFACQTGNALDVAELISREAERRGCHAFIVSTDEFSPICTRNLNYGKISETEGLHMSRQVPKLIFFSGGATLAADIGDLLLIKVFLKLEVLLIRKTRMAIGH
ncbi:Flavoprotein-like domain protein [Raphanus sativus]|nr:Flavoprotein-like domain protein [Raphanus sativus]